MHVIDRWALMGSHLCPWHPCALRAWPAFASSTESYATLQGLLPPPPPLWQTRCPNVLEPLVMANKFLRQHAGARPPAPFAASRFSRSCADPSSTSEAWTAPSETASDMVLLRHQPQPPPPVKRVALVKLLCELQHLLEVETSYEPPTPGVVLGPLRLHRLARSHGCNPTVVCTVAGETAMAISASLGGQEPNETKPGYFFS